MQLTNTKKFGFDNNNDQEQVSDVEEMKATHSQSLGNKKTITGKYFRINAQKDNIINAIDYSDAPDEFIDSISAELMTDPVLLPTSNQILDRSTIEQHLLSDPKDPFNRRPLSKNDLIPQVELKQKIEEYKKTKSIN